MSGPTRTTEEIWTSRIRQASAVFLFIVLADYILVIPPPLDPILVGVLGGLGSALLGIHWKAGK